MNSKTISCSTLNSKRVSILLLICSLLPISGFAIRWPWEWNQLDKEGNRHGRWRTYQEIEGKKKLFNKGHYKHGREKGRWVTYSPSGELYVKEKVEPAKNRIKKTFFHTNGQVSHKGIAYQFEKNKLWKYTMHGDWQYYDSTGKLLGVKTFIQGRVVADTTPSPERISTKILK